MEMKPLGAIFSLPDKQIEFVVRFDKKRDVSIVEETWFGPWREIFSSNKSKEVLDTSLIEQSVFEQGVVEWAKIWPQYIHSGQR